MKKELNAEIMESVAGGVSREETIKKALEIAKNLHLGEPTLPDSGPTVIRTIGSGDPPRLLDRLTNQKSLSF